MKQEELRTVYGCLWDKWLPDLYRFALFLTNDPSQASVYLEQMFFGCWNSGAFPKALRSCGRENAVKLLFYRELWRRWSGFFGTEEAEIARLYLLHVQQFREGQIQKIIKG